VDQARTGRALSNAYITFPKRRFQLTREPPEVLKTFTVGDMNPHSHPKWEMHGNNDTQQISRVNTKHTIC
jgi:hypothetical protein